MTHKSDNHCSAKNTSQAAANRNTAQISELSQSEWLDQEILQIAMGDPLLDATKIKELKSRAKLRGIILESGRIKERLSKLRSAANGEEKGNQSYDALIERLNKDYFIYEGGDKITIASWTKVNGRRSLVQRTAADFRVLLANEPKVFSPIENARIPAAEAWLRSPARRSVKGFVFEADPQKAKAKLADGYENLFEGFSIDPQKGEIDLFLQHLREVIVAEEPEDTRSDHVEYLLDCFAHLVQKPGVPLKVALVFRGRQGAGKSFLAEMIASLFKGNVFATSHADDIVGRFTGHLLNIALLIGDEALFAGSKKDADSLKHIITQDTLRIEAKHRDVMNEKNRLSLLLTSNHEHAVRLEPGDRRFYVLDVSDVKTPQRDHQEYWDELWNWAKSETGKAALLHYLLHRDLSKFDPQSSRPATQANLDQLIASLDPVLRWFFEVLVEGATSLDRLLTKVNSAELSDETRGYISEHHLSAYKKSSLLRAYRAWEKEHCARFNPTDTRLFWKTMKRILPAELITKKRLAGQDNPVHLILLPPRDQMNELFLAAVGFNGFHDTRGDPSPRE